MRQPSNLLLHNDRDVLLMLRLAAIFAFLPSAAVAQNYLVEPSLAQCLTRSAQQCTSLSCDGVKTIYWWPCITLTTPTTTGGVSGVGGSAAIVIWPGTPFGVTTNNKAHAVGVGLTIPEQADVQTAADLAGNL